MEDCVFCKIVEGSAPAFKIWEDDYHLAFLTIYPNTSGQAVVITKRHYPSYFADVDGTVLAGLIIAAKEVARLIDKAFWDVGRTALVFEGWGVDHLHVKLYPMHGTSDEALQGKDRLHLDRQVFFDTYPGYVTTENKHTRMSDEDLRKIQEKILKAKKRDE